MKLKVKIDLTSGITLAIASIILWVMIPSNIVVTGGENNAQLFPRIVVCVMFLLATYIAVSSIISKNDKIIIFDLKKEAGIILFVAALFVFVFLMDKLGFIIASLIIGSISLFFYRVKWKVYIALAIFIVCVYFLFTFALGIPLP